MERQVVTPRHDCICPRPVANAAIAMAMEESSARRLVARALRQERTRQREPSQTIPSAVERAQSVRERTRSLGKAGEPFRVGRLLRMGPEASAATVSWLPTTDMKSKRLSGLQSLLVSPTSSRLAQRRVTAALPLARPRRQVAASGPAPARAAMSRDGSSSGGAAISPAERRWLLCLALASSVDRGKQSARPACGPGARKSPPQGLFLLGGTGRYHPWARGGSA